MRFQSVFVVLIIAATVFVCGCTGDGTKPQSQPFIPAETEGSVYLAYLNQTPDYLITDDGRLNLKGAFTVFENSVEDGYLPGENYSFRIIRGINTDINGNCETWVAGALRDGEEVLLRYTSSGWSEDSWPGGLEGDEIDTEGIIMPFELFNKNSVLISKVLNGTISNYADLEIRSDIYTITYSDGGSLKSLRFDSKTGDVI